MLLSEQIRAARALLDWNQDRLAQEAGVGPSTVKRMEAHAGPATGQAESVWKIQTALEKAGVTFISEDGTNGPGVRLAHPYQRK